jgi:hypothetical protein
MWLDELNEFADALALSTAATGIANVGDIIDLGAGSKPLNDIADLYLVITIDTAVTSGGAATVQFLLVSDSGAIATDGSATQHWASAAIPKATLVAGYVVAVVPLPKQPLYERYLGIQQNVGTAALTAGKFNAFLTLDPSNWVAIADGTQ